MLDGHAGRIGVDHGCELSISCRRHVKSTKSTVSQSRNGDYMEAIREESCLESSSIRFRHDAFLALSQSNCLHFSASSQRNVPLKAAAQAVHHLLQIPSLQFA